MSQRDIRSFQGTKIGGGDNERQKKMKPQQKDYDIKKTHTQFKIPPDGSVGRVSAFGAGGCGFESLPHHTKGVKNGTSSSLADARLKGVVLGRLCKAGKYLFKRYCYVTIKALQSLCCLFKCLEDCVRQASIC